MKITKSHKIYSILVLILGVSAAVNLFLPQGIEIGLDEMPASKPVMALVNFFIMVIGYGGLGLLGLFLSGKLGFAEIWDEHVTNYQRFGFPALLGLGIGIFFIINDIAISQFTEIGHLPHPPFPTSIVASISAGIGEEIIFRLFFISFWVWLVAHIILKKRWTNRVFWIVTIISALVFAVGHLPSGMLMLGYETIADVPAIIFFEMFLLNGVLAIFAAYYFRKFGFLAAVGIHFWTDIVWHVFYGYFI